MLVAGLVLHEHREAPEPRRGSGPGPGSIACSDSGSGTGSLASSAANQRRAASGNRQLRAYDRAETSPLRRLVEPRHAVDAVCVEQRERRVPERRGARHERFGQRGALQKTKRGCGVEFDIHGPVLGATIGWADPRQAGTAASWRRV